MMIGVVMYAVEWGDPAATTIRSREDPNANGIRHEFRIIRSGEHTMCTNDESENVCLCTVYLCSQYRKVSAPATSGENMMNSPNSSKAIGFKDTSAAAKDNSSSTSGGSSSNRKQSPVLVTTANTTANTTATISNERDSTGSDGRSREDDHNAEDAKDNGEQSTRDPQQQAHNDQSSSGGTNANNNPNYITLTIPFTRSTFTVPKFMYRLLKQETLMRMFKVVTAFPFVIVVASINISNGYISTLLRSETVIRIMNFMIYVLPILIVKFALSKYTYAAAHDITIGLYLLLYLLPVALVVSKKLSVSSSTNKIEEGTFCFKPARSVRCTQSNFYSMLGFMFEWFQHIVYVIPIGIISSSNKQTLISDYPPYIPFNVYFWMSVASTFLCALIVVLNAVLKGKIHYKYQKTGIIWYILYNISSPMFVTIVTILFMGLSCDFSVDPPTLVQDPSLVCYSPKHITMARAALMGLAIYLVQHTLLPSGTFKETMGDNDLEIMFVPVYLQAHFLLKALFCGIYVFFYRQNAVRVIALTFINILLLCLNNFMKPCSVDWINVMRDTFFIHATLSGIQSLNYLVWPVNLSTKSMVLSTLASNVIFVTIAMSIYYRYTFRSTEFTIMRAFLELEWQVCELAH
jgi:hypothetical protein